MMLLPAIGYASNFYKTSYIDAWRNVKVTLNADHPVISYGAEYHAYVTIKNISRNPVSVPLDSNCHVGYRLLNNDKRIIRDKSLGDGTCINFDYGDLRLMPDEEVNVDFYIGGLEAGTYRAVFEVNPVEDMVVDFKVLEEVSRVSSLGGSCGFSSRNRCEMGLVCNFDGVLPGMPGTCTEPYYDRLNYKHSDDVDFIEWDGARPVESPYSIDEYNYGGTVYSIDKKWSFDDAKGYVLEEDFERYMKIVTGREVDIESDSAFVRRDVALTAVYRTMYRNRHPEDLRVYAFKDSKWSPYGNYIEESARLGFINVSESKYFLIDGWLKWEDLREWVRKF